MALYSWQLKPVEKNYSITELETLAIVDAVRHLKKFIYGVTPLSLSQTTSPTLMS